jgi:hypothetical protein
MYMYRMFAHSKSAPGRSSIVLQAGSRCVPGFEVHSSSLYSVPIRALRGFKCDRAVRGTYGADRPSILAGCRE